MYGTSGIRMPKPRTPTTHTMNSAASGCTRLALMCPAAPDQYAGCSMTGHQLLQLRAHTALRRRFGQSPNHKVGQARLVPGHRFAGTAGIGAEQHGHSEGRNQPQPPVSGPAQKECVIGRKALGAMRRGWELDSESHGAVRGHRMAHALHPDWRNNALALEAPVLQQH